jgi:hypothetical protein
MRKVPVTATQVRTTALWALSAQFMYHFTYGFCCFGGMRRCLAVPKANRADISSLSSSSMTGNFQRSSGRSAEI